MAPLSARLRGQLYLAVFFIVWIVASTLSHMVGRELFTVAREVRASEKAGIAIPEEEVQAAAGKGIGLVVVNLPLFVAVGPMLRADPPEPGPLYWVVLVLGSIYVPAFVTMCVFFMLHAPSSGVSMPGVDWDDGTRDDNAEEIKDDDANR